MTMMMNRHILFHNNFYVRASC